MAFDCIQSLWIGPALSKLEQLSIQSFLDHGHEYHLYVYKHVRNIPEGCVVKDANEIIPEAEIYTYNNGSVAAFSNLFRYTLMYKMGGYWADTDCICMRPILYANEIVISSEPGVKYNDKHINCGLIRFGKGSAEALEGIQMQRRHKPLVLNGTIKWGSCILTIKHIVKKFKLEQHVLPWQGICSCNPRDYMTLVDSRIVAPAGAIVKLEDVPPEMVCIHFWNEMFRRNEVDLDSDFDPDSLYEVLKRKHHI